MLQLMLKLPRIEKFYKCHVETHVEARVETHAETLVYSEILQVSEYFFICNIVAARI